MNHRPTNRAGDTLIGADAVPGTPAGLSSVTVNPSRWFYGSLGLLIFLGVALRVAYIDHDCFNPDEQIASAVVRNLSFPNQWDTNWAKSDVSAAFHYGQYNFSSYHYLLYCWKSLLTVIGIGMPNNFGALRALNGLFGLIFLGTIALALRQSVGEIAGLAATAAGATLPLLVQDAHYLRCEAMLTAGVATLLYFTTGPEPKPRWVVFFGGVIAGWMIASKVTMVIALPLLFSSEFRTLREWKTVLGFACLIAFGCILGFVMGVPGGVLQPAVYLSGLEEMTRQYSSPLPPYTSPDMAASLRITLAYMKGTLGWGFWLITAVGLSGLIRLGGWRRTAILVSPLAVALFFFGSHAFFAERSFSPFIPIAALLFGAGVQFMAEAMVSSGKFARCYRAFVVTLLLTTTLALPTIYSWQITAHGFSGREQLEKDTALRHMKGNLAGKTQIIYGAIVCPEDYRKLSAATQQRESVLLVLIDYYDPNTAACLAKLQSTFGARILGVRESLFPDLPACTLHTFMSPRLWLLYVPAR